MEPGPKVRPRRVSQILFLCAALGAFGVVIGFSGVTSWNQPFPEEPAAFEIPLPPAPEGEEAAWKKLEEVWEQVPAPRLEVLKERRALLNALAAVNLISSMALFIGALSTRRRGAGGLRFLHTGLALSQAYALLGAVVQGWVQKEVLDSQKALFQPLLAEGGQVATFAATALASQTIAVFFGVGVMGAQLLFYVWAQRYFHRPEVVATLAAPPPAQRP